MEEYEKALERLKSEGHSSEAIQDLVLMTQVLNDTLLELEEFNDDESKQHSADCFNLLQKVINNITK